MSRYTKPKRQASARERKRLAARQIANGDIDITKTVPHPPDPGWAHWWDPSKRVWMKHDPRVVEWVIALAKCPDPSYLTEITAMIRLAPGLVPAPNPE